MTTDRASAADAEVPVMDEREVAAWLCGLRLGHEAVVAAAAGVALDALMEVCTRRRKLRCGRAATAETRDGRRSYLQ